ncbi:hypothetical protein GQ600_5841 [Phytophthora cactorum]|nr:hypothetical protein GQ600_5841 [Phytophthora cactorum]
MGQVPSTDRDLITAGDTTADSKARIRPSAMQRPVHRHLINGTYASMGFQLLLETIQILLQSLDLLPHPAVIRGLFEWDFATKGLSTMQFISVTDAERRARREQYDLSDFSRKNKLTRASDATVHLSFVAALVEQAQQFVRKLSRSKLGRHFVIAEARSDLLNWIDERFECVDVYAVYKAFNERGGGSFVQLIHVVSECRLAYSEQRQNTINRSTNSGHGQRGQDLLRVLPTSNGKALCMKYLSKMGCPSRRDGRFSRKRGHFCPTSIPAKVRDIIVQHYGGFKAEFVNIAVDEQA